MPRFLLEGDSFEEEVASSATQGSLVDASTTLGGGDDMSEGASLQSALLMAQDKVAEQHTTVHAFHHHIHPRGTRRGGSSGTGIIWLLIILHVAFVAYWAYFWWTTRKQREEKKGKSSVPQKVNCVYDWTPQIPLPNIQLAPKTAQH